MRQMPAPSWLICRRRSIPSRRSKKLLAGVIQSRLGPRPIATIGGLLFSSGLLFASFTQSLTMLYLTWGVMVGIGLGFGYLIPITVGSKWFPDHRGLVSGLAIGIASQLGGDGAQHSRRDAGGQSAVDADGLPGDVAACV